MAHLVAQHRSAAFYPNTDPTSRGGVLGLGQAFAGSGRIIGPALAGVVFADWHKLAFLFGAFAMVIMALANRLIAVKRSSDINVEILT